ADHEAFAALEQAVDQALGQIRDKGAILVPFELPEAGGIKDIFSTMLPSDLLATLGRDYYLKERDNIDPVTAARLDMAANIPAPQYISLVRRYHRLGLLGAAHLKGLDGFLSPTTPLLPMPVADCLTPEAAGSFTARSLQNTRPGNAYNLCAASIPLQNSGLPVGLQLHCPAGHESRLLEICMALEKALAGRS
ncbi:MAG: amidase family protein, partial [Desulfonatronovibrionaceae bacterium]